jgi:hypothetical protein
VTSRRVITSISDIETVCEASDFESPFVHYRLEPIMAVGKVLHACSTFNLRN